MEDPLIAGRLPVNKVARCTELCQKVRHIRQYIEGVKTLHGSSGSLGDPAHRNVPRHLHRGRRSGTAHIDDGVLCNGRPA